MTVLPADGGKTEIDIPSCARDALAFVYFARREMGQGRVAPAQKVFFGGAYSAQLQYTGEMTVQLGGEVRGHRSRAWLSVKGPQSDFSVEVFFARDAARTPLVIKVPLSARDALAGAGPLDAGGVLLAAAAGAQRDRRLLRSARRRAAASRGAGGLLERDQHFDPARFDIALYQIGNNGYHGFVYETALRHPGVVVMHESNLHHLIADLTIKRGDWDAYVRECEYEGGAAAREFAERVRKLEVGPDYEGVPMTRRLLERSRGVVVHSRFMEDEMRRGGLHGPGRGDPARRVDSGGRPQRLPPPARAGRVHAAGRHLRIPEAVQAHRRIAARVPAAGAPGAERAG